MVNNLQQLLEILEFEEHSFYKIQIIKRKKDLPQDQQARHKSARVVKSYYVYSREYLELVFPEIQKLCEVFEARAYIGLGRKNDLDVTLQLMSQLTEGLKNKQYRQVGLLDSAIDRTKSQNKLWVVDVDSKDYRDVEYLKKLVGECRPHREILCTLPTPNGYHLIVEPFDTQHFEKSLAGQEKPDIVKHGLTLLYTP